MRRTNRLPLGERELRFFSALSDRPGQQPTQEANGSGESNELASGPSPLRPFWQEAAERTTKWETHPYVLMLFPQEGQRHIHLLTRAFRIILPNGIETSKAVSTLFLRAEGHGHFLPSVGSAEPVRY
jgi:hypothetical protein